MFVCKECGGVNCYLWQTKCKNENKPITFLGKCKGVPSKFGGLSKFALPFKPSPFKNKKGPKTNTSHSPALVSPQIAPANDENDGFDSWDEDDQPRRNAFGFRLNQVGMTAGANESEDESDEEYLFDCECEDSWKHECKQEFYCKICQKSGTVNFDKLIEHLWEEFDFKAEREKYLQSSLQFPDLGIT